MLILLQPNLVSPVTLVFVWAVSEGTINYLVATHTKSLLVYQDVTLKWAAKTEFTPVQCHVANFK